MADWFIQGEARKKVEELLGRSLPEPLFKFRPAGDLVVVAVAIASEATQSGLLYKPEGVRRAEEGGLGFIISFGPECTDRLWLAAGITIQDDILGRSAIWGFHAGTALPVDDHESEYQARFRIMAEDKLLLVEWGA